MLQANYHPLLSAKLYTISELLQFQLQLQFLLQLQQLQFQFQNCIQNQISELIKQDPHPLPKLHIVLFVCSYVHIIMYNCNCNCN